MSWPLQDHANAVLALLAADVLLVTYDGRVPDPPAVPVQQYVLVYMSASTPDGAIAPDKVRLSNDSDVIDLSIVCHCVGGDAVAARAISGRVRALLLNVRPVIAGRVCMPIRWREGQPAQRDETTGRLVMDQVDVYGLVTVPG